MPSLKQFFLSSLFFFIVDQVNGGGGSMLQPPPPLHLLLGAGGGAGSLTSSRSSDASFAYDLQAGQGAYYGQQQRRRGGVGDDGMGSPIRRFHTPQPQPSQIPLAALAYRRPSDGMLAGGGMRMSENVPILKHFCLNILSKLLNI